MNTDTRVSRPDSSARRRRHGRALVTLLALAVAPVSTGAAAAVLDKAAEGWLAKMSLFLLPEEETLFRELGIAKDREEFQQIFWARRDPDPSTPVNELQEAVAQVAKRADELYSVSGRKGSETGCGKVLALLGEPRERAGREARALFENDAYLRQGALAPETWTYRDRPGYPISFTGGALSIAFDSNCEFAEGGRVLEELRRVAASLVVRPEIGYRRSAAGGLVPLEEVLPAPSGGALLVSGRSDFPMTVEPTLLLRTQTGEAYAAGLVRAELGAEGQAGAGATLVAAVVDDSGEVRGLAERSVRPATVEGAAIASWGLKLPAGRHTVRVGMTAGGRAAVAPVTLDVPDFAAPGLTTSSLVVFPEGGAPPGDDPDDAYGALAVGTMRLRPRYGNVFKSTDAIQVVCVLYGGTVDPATGKAALRTRFSFLKGDRPVAQDQPQVFDTPNAVASVGPVPLSGFDPGRYVVRLEIEDQVAGAKERREAPFEIME
jgi:GWxTD domain-containing protein